MENPVCKNCEYAKRDWFGWQFATCEAPENIQVDPVTGATDVYKFSKYCSVQRRGDVGDCADVGRWFKPKQRRSFLDRLMRR